MYQAVEILCCLRAMFVLTQNPTQSSNIQQDFEHCRECFSGFYVKHIQKHLETLASFLYKINVFFYKNSFLKVVATTLVNPHFTSE